MSAPTVSPPPGPPKGPRETRIDWLWDQAWTAVREGQAHQFWLAQAAAELNQFKAALAPSDIAGAADLKSAENFDRSHREQFHATWERNEENRKTFIGLRDFLMKDVATTGRFAFQTLTLANGAVALGVLGYMGRDGNSPIPHGLIWALILSAVGFLLMILSAHVAMLRVQPYLRHLTQLTLPYLSEEERDSKIKDVPKVAKQATLPSRILAYIATGCLICAVITGALTLWNSAEGQQQRAQQVLRDCAYNE